MTRDFEDVWKQIVDVACDYLKSGEEVPTLANSVGNKIKKVTDTAIFRLSKRSKQGQNTPDSGIRKQNRSASVSRRSVSAQDWEIQFAG